MSADLLPSSPDTNPSVKAIESEGNSPGSSGADIQVPDETLRQLSRQLEYYFSSLNLSKDTYLRTLRELNDGYVPVTILANFAKVQLLCPFQSYEAVIKAADVFSEHLEVVYVDKESSKRVSAENPNTLIAIGPKDSKPIELPSTPSFVRPTIAIPTVEAPPLPSSTTPVIQNTIILRDVPPGVTEDDLRVLFDFAKCPPIQEVYEDVANCWFVVLKTTSRDDMVNVMFALRSKLLNGEPVKARLKAAPAISPAPSEAVYGVPPAAVFVATTEAGYAGDRNMSYQATNGTLNGTKSGNKRNSSKSQQQNAPRSPGNGKKPTKKGSRKPKSAISSPSAKKPVKEHQQQAPLPPSLEESHFPALEPVKRVIGKEDVKVVDDDDAKRVSSDGASTATTSTSSSVVGDNGVVCKVKLYPVSGYAAALLKAPMAKPPPLPKPADKADEEKPKNGVTKSRSRGTQAGNGLKETTPKDEVLEKKPQDQAQDAQLKAVSSPWGGGKRSFADVLKKENAAANEADQ